MDRKRQATQSARINPNPERAIALQTYDGTDIPNGIDRDPDDKTIEGTRRWIGMQGMMQAGAVKLGPPTGRYNCHGLVFASRRTNIPPAGMSTSVNIDDLLKSDLYVRVPSPQTGDIIVYRTEDQNREVDHTGIVTRVDFFGGTPSVLVWSKWGALEEWEHNKDNCPYKKDCTIEYWRLAS